MGGSRLPNRGSVGFQVLVGGVGSHNLKRSPLPLFKSLLRTGFDDIKPWNELWNLSRSKHYRALIYEQPDFIDFFTLSHRLMKSANAANQLPPARRQRW